MNVPLPQLKKLRLNSNAWPVSAYRLDARGLANKWHCKCYLENLEHILVSTATGPTELDSYLNYAKAK